MMSTLTRLTRLHMLSTAADACIAVALAGTLFFSVSTAAARSQMALFLLLTLAPFAIVTPLLVPLIERSRRPRVQVLATTDWVRAGLALALAANPFGLALLPASFAVLVCGRAYAITKRTLVPIVVADSRELVGANAQLSRAGTVAAAIGAATATAVMHVVGIALVLQISAALHVAAAIVARRIHAFDPADIERPPNTRSGPSGSMVGRPIVTMAGLRAAMGLLCFTVAFAIRTDEATPISLGIVALMVPVGSLAGTFVSPRLRLVMTDERAVLHACLVVSAIVVGITALTQTSMGLPVAVLGVALASSVGRHAYDSILQRDVVARERSRVIARGEVALQLSWVAGALVPTVFVISQTAGHVGVAGLLGTLSLLLVRAPGADARVLDRVLSPVGGKLVV